jgi:predicted ArsR family transcriptional regulator
VELLATTNSLPIYVTSSTAHLEVAEAEPASQLTATERQTLAAVSALGGRVRAAELAERLHLQHTAAVNRLASLAAKGYLYRQSQPGRSGDVFVDPRHPSVGQTLDGLLAEARHDLPPEDYKRVEEILLRSLARRRSESAEPSSY